MIQIWCCLYIKIEGAFRSIKHARTGTEPTGWRSQAINITDYYKICDKYDAIFSLLVNLQLFQCHIFLHIKQRLYVNRLIQQYDSSSPFFIILSFFFFSLFHGIRMDTLRRSAAMAGTASISLNMGSSATPYY